jgi:hypothetical protein
MDTEVNEREALLDGQTVSYGHSNFLYSTLSCSKRQVLGLEKFQKEFLIGELNIYFLTFRSSHLKGFDRPKRHFLNQHI